MVAPDEPAPVLFAERGASWWPVLWGPAFALVGLGAEAATGGGHPVVWLLTGLALAVAAAVWVQARRRVCSVELTPFTLRQGREVLPVARIAAVTDVGLPAGAAVLGGGWTPPRGTTGLPVRLDTGVVVLAWARDLAGLRAALTRLLATTTSDNA
ncbi:hypothetical protein [Goodfellowiella coeruleoviolacea]|uniref:DUF3093 domain-containing protein n=1 Tax=Goodfellowiella coeruleoviolacea TaxID=334858 RepID=A0AAE3KGB4_9PSEU|nr:hypothetical protein [Goodfellowiella coeruleoviolacea]MCP2165980.1 hypothetical protein [Goodfellowiella coeruleoviolacea]